MTPKDIVFCRSNPVEPDPRVEKAMRALASAGYSVRLVCWDREGLSAANEVRTGIGFTRIKIPALYGSGMRNLFSLLRWQAALFDWLVQHQESYQYIHACDFDTLIPALLCKLLFGKRVVYDIFDFYADNLNHTPRIIRRIIRAVDLKLMAGADVVILADESRVTQIAGSRPRRLEIIYNTPEDAAPGGKTGCETHQADCKPELPFCIVYVGQLQADRGLRCLVSAVVKHPEWRLHVAGSGVEADYIRQMAATSENIIWHGKVSYEAALRLMAAADCLVAVYDPVLPNNRFASPNKIFEAMMLAKAVITSRQTNAETIVAKKGCGWIVEYGDQKALEETLRMLAGDRSLREGLGRRGRQAYEEEYSWEAMKRRLIRLYEETGAGN